jgi:hypothetical protein
VLRTVGPQGSLFELFLPAGMRVLSGELIDLLDRTRHRPPQPKSRTLYPRSTTSYTSTISGGSS